MGKEGSCWTNLVF